MILLFTTKLSLTILTLLWKHIKSSRSFRILDGAYLMWQYLFFTLFFWYASLIFLLVRPSLVTGFLLLMVNLSVFSCTYENLFIRI